MDPNIYQTYATALHGDPSNPDQFAGNVAQANAKIDDIKTQNAKEAAAAANDPNKARMVLLPNDQGYAFYDGTGKRIGINDYSLLVGKTPAQLLSDSPNPQDQKFVSDYNTLHAFVNAWVNGDKDTLAKMKAADPKTFNSLVTNYKSPSDVINAFTQHWSDYYTPGVSSNQSVNTPSLSPNMNANQVGSKTLAALGSSTLPQILSPDVPKAPRDLNFLERINPFSGQRDEINRYKSTLQSNPWSAYQSALSGNPYGIQIFSGMQKPSGG